MYSDWAMQNKSNLFFIFFTVLITVVLFSQPQVSIAASYNKNFIISDSDMTDYSRMSVDAIQSLLDKYGGLATYRAMDVDGVEKSAAEIIYRSAYRTD